LSNGFTSGGIADTITSMKNLLSNMNLLISTQTHMYSNKSEKDQGLSFSKIFNQGRD